MGQLFYNGDLPTATQRLQFLCKQLQIEEGLLARTGEPERVFFLQQGDLYAEDKLRGYYQTPFVKVWVPLLTDLDPSGVAEVMDYPEAVKNISLHRAAQLLLSSEYGENEPNRSQISDVLKERLEEMVLEARHRVRVRVGTGRLKNPNPFMPPSLAPLAQEEKEKL